jgi:hypothetical protein
VGWQMKGVKPVQSRLGKVNDELCDDGGASILNQSGLKRSTTDLGVCTKDRATAHTCVSFRFISLTPIELLSS